MKLKVIVPDGFMSDLGDPHGLDWGVYPAVQEVGGRWNFESYWTAYLDANPDGTYDAVSLPPGDYALMPQRYPPAGMWGNQVDPHGRIFLLAPVFAGSIRDQYDSLYSGDWSVAGRAGA